MENIQNIENKEVVESESSQHFDEKELQKNLDELKKAEDDEKKQRDSELKMKMYKLNEDTDKKERVSEFIRDNCSEPISGVDKVVPYKDLVEILLKWAEDEWKEDVKKSILDGKAKDKRIYELSAYKKLVDNGFILPSDVRNYYDSANREPVYHLGVDYNIKAWTEVKSIYDGKVVASGLDWWLWHKVIVEHTTENWDKFYSLYGHMWSSQLPTVWSDVKKWDLIWKVWQPFTQDNWDWEEHLHFQIMEDKDSPRWYSKNEWEWNYDVLKSFGKK